MGYSSLELSILFVDDELMAQLNREYRNKEGSTNVLAFPMWEGEPSPHMGMLGDIVISIPTAKAEAEERGIGLKERVTELLVHGLLHLLGHDHNTDEEALIMEREEHRLKGIIGGSDG